MKEINTKMQVVKKLIDKSNKNNMLTYKEIMETVCLYFSLSSFSNQFANEISSLSYGSLAISLFKSINRLNIERF